MDLGLSEQQQRVFTEYLERAVYEAYMGYLANGYVVFRRVPAREDATLQVVVAVRPDEYELQFTAAPESGAREYTAYMLREDKPLKNGYVAMFEEPENSGLARGRIMPVLTMLNIHTASLVDHYYAHRHRTHPQYVTQPTANASRIVDQHVAAAPQYSADDDRYVEDTRERVSHIHAVEQDEAIGDAENTAHVIAAQALTALAHAHGTSLMGRDDPVVAAVRQPPFANVLRLPLDRQIAAHVPVPQLDPQMTDLQQQITSIVNALMGAPPSMTADVKERTAEEASILWRYYHNAVVRLSGMLSNQLSLCMREMTAPMLRRMFKRKFDAQQRVPDGESDASRLARLTLRRNKATAWVDTLQVNVELNHVPLIEPEKVQQLFNDAYISEEKATQLMGAFYSLRPDEMNTPEQREQQRKRRNDEEIGLAKRMAVATGKPPKAGEPGGPPKK